MADISYSVKSALKFSANTASTLGRMMGSLTLRKVANQTHFSHFYSTSFCYTDIKKLTFEVCSSW